MDLTNNTWAFAIIFLVAFILGWLLHKLMTTCCDNDYDMDMDGDMDTDMNMDSDISTGAVASTAGAGLASLAAAAGYKLDDLKMVEGIGPAIEKLLHAADITTWRELANTEVSTLTNVLTQAGDRFKFHDPATWPEQAGLAADGKFDELKEYQDYLDGGKDLA